jgi:hypothetical protein
MMNILALDLGTKTGYCYNTPVSGGTFSGTWDLSTKERISKDRMNRRRDPRPKKLFTILNTFAFKPDLVVFEDVDFQTYTYQTQLWASLRTAMWLAFPETVVFDCVPVSTLKKFATGYGSADKALMKKYLLSKFPDFDKVNADDNEIDAIWLYQWAQKNLSRMAL